MEKFAKRQFISDIKDGDRIDDVFVVKIKKGVSDYASGYTFHLLLSDSSGKNIDYRYWGGKDEAIVRKLYESIKADSVILVKGKFSFYKGMPQIMTNEPDTVKVLEIGQYDESDFVKKPKKDVEKMYEDLIMIIESVKDEQLKRLLLCVFKDDKIKDKFKVHPGGIEIHHNWIGGLIQHTLETARYCELCAQLHPTINRDLVITGALLHDIGKLDEMEVTARIKGTRKGQMHGHIVLGSILVSNKMNELKIGEDTKDKLLHIIISHHGSNELGSPKEPMFPEALAVYYADEMSSKISEITEYVEDNKEETEDEFKYHYKKERNIFLR
ncbi:MAG: HD domain-containing protein [Candidatus Aenigmatarchaeota archaeon]